MSRRDADVLEIQSASRVSEDGAAVREISAAFQCGRLHLLTGAPGSGYELLLRMLGLLEAPDAGEVLVEGQPTRVLSEEDRAELRTKRFGFVFASPFLLSSFSVVENIAMPLLKLSHATTEEARQRTEDLLKLVDMADAAEAAIADLTPCAQYCVAVARGLVHEPAILIVEQLDGMLAGEDLHSFAGLLRRVASRCGIVVIASVSEAFAEAHPDDRILEITGGIVRRDSAVLRELETE